MGAFGNVYDAMNHSCIRRVKHQILATLYSEMLKRQQAVSKVCKFMCVANDSFNTETVFDNTAREQAVNSSAILNECFSFDRYIVLY